MKLLARLVIVGLLVAGCGGGSATPSASEDAPTPTSVPTTTAAITATPTGTPTAVATPAPTPTPTLVVAPTPTPAAAGTAVCAYPITIAGTATPESQAVIADVRADTHAADGYDRIVFQFAGATYPTLQLKMVAPPFVHDPSGLPFTVSGMKFLELRLEPATRHGGYSGATTLTLTGGKLVQVVEGGDFEAIVHWVAGLTGDSCVHAFALGSPTRLVIDIERP